MVSLLIVINFEKKRLLRELIEELVYGFSGQLLGVSLIITPQSKKKKGLRSVLAQILSHEYGVSCEFHLVEWLDLNPNLLKYLMMS